MTSPCSENFRVEHDLLGSMEINDEYFYGIQTQRAINDFQLSTNRLQDNPELILALALIKSACAQANLQQGLLSE
jgi:aspartate ammonia-lyase